MVEPQPSKLMMRVRFPSPAPKLEAETCVVAAHDALRAARAPLGS